MLTRLRFAIARLLNQNNSICWSDLATWANGYTEFKNIDRSGACTRPPYFIPETGGCYCGKHRCEIEEAHHVTEA